jgi:hypothetical protein
MPLLKTITAMENKNNRIKRREWIENAVYALEDFLKEKDPSLELIIHQTNYSDFTDQDDGSFSLSCSSIVWPTKENGLLETPTESAPFYASFWEIDLYILLEIPPDGFFVFDWDLFPLIKRRGFFDKLPDTSFIPHLPLLKAAKKF